MPSRILFNNRVVFQSSDLQVRDWRKSLPRGRDGEPVDSASAIPSHSPRSPFRAGVGLLDRDEDLVYRCVANLNPLEGWALTEFWQRRWKVEHRDVIEFARLGWLDAAVEEMSQVRRFRCRDEAGLLRSEDFKKVRKRVTMRKDRRQLAELLRGKVGKRGL